MKRRKEKPERKGHENRTPERALAEEKRRIAKQTKRFISRGPGRTDIAAERQTEETVPVGLERGPSVRAAWPTVWSVSSRTGRLRLYWWADVETRGAAAQDKGG